MIGGIHHGSLFGGEKREEIAACAININSYKTCSQIGKKRKGFFIEERLREREREREMGYSSLLKSPKKEGAEEEQEVPNSIWDDFKAFFELSNEEKLPLQQQENFSIVNGGPLNWDLMDHHSNHQFSLSETKTNHSGHGDGVEAEVFSRVVPKACSFDGDGVMESKKKASLNLNLNYEEVSEAWSGRGSLWAAGGSSPSNPTHNVYVSCNDQLSYFILYIYMPIHP